MVALLSGVLIPLWVKLLLTGFVVVLVVCYWRDYGPTNFLYLCDLALLLTVAAVWLESPLLASVAAVAILLPQTLWMVDFLGGLCGAHLTGMTAYMFNPRRPLFTRWLSFFHFWLPLFLVWAVWRLGYDSRALLVATVGACVVLSVCYLWLPAPPAPPDRPGQPVNVNYVFGPGDDQPQPWLHPRLYFGLLLAGLPAVAFWPTHLFLRAFFPPAR